jgi:hypothetical protein
MKKLAYLTALVAALALVVSCATTPPKQPEPEQPPQETPKETPKTSTPAPDADLQQAKDLRQKVDAYNLGSLDAEDYDAGVKALQAGQDAYGKDNDAARVSLQASIASFKAVLAKGGALYLGQEQQKTEVSKKAADDLKASVAVKDDYAGAMTVYERALKEKDAQDIDNASQDFGQAQKMFDAVAVTAQKKKTDAESALSDARKGGADAEKKASDAQQALKDEGFAVTGAAQ